MIQKLKTLDNNKLLKIIKVSVLINILLISVVAGHFIFDKKTYHKRGFEKHHVVDKKIMKQYRKALTDKKIELEQALLEQPYNQQRVTQAFIALDAQMAAVRDTVNQAIIKKAATLEPEERVKLLSPNLRKHLKKAKEHRSQE
jgi:uncharacterized membrane protein